MKQFHFDLFTCYLHDRDSAGKPCVKIIILSFLTLVFPPKSYHVLFIRLGIAKDSAILLQIQLFGFNKYIKLRKGKPEKAQHSEEQDSEVKEELRHTGIIEGLEWINWVAANENGEIVGYDDKPVKSDHWWNHPDSRITLLTNGVLITAEQAKAMCGIVPEWSDEEPTPVLPQGIVEQAISFLVKRTVYNTIEDDIAQIKTWAKWVATDEDGDVYAFASKPFKSRYKKGVWVVSIDSIDIDKKSLKITHDQALSLCGRVPKWTDTEPTPVIKTE